MDRYFYQDMVVPDHGQCEYLVFDRTRGCSEDEYALAVCTDPDIVQRIVDLLNQAEAFKEERRIARVIEAREALGDEIVEPDKLAIYEVETYRLKGPRE